MAGCAGQLVAHMLWGILGGVVDNIEAQHDRFADGLWRILWARWGIFELGCGRGLNTWQQLGHRALPHWRAVVEEGQDPCTKSKQNTAKCESEKKIAVVHGGSGWR